MSQPTNKLKFSWSNLVTGLLLLLVICAAVPLAIGFGPASQLLVIIAGVTLAKIYPAWTPVKETENETESN